MEALRILAFIISIASLCPMSVVVIMTRTAGGIVEKVTQKLEQADSGMLMQLQKAVRTIYGVGDPDLEQEAFLRALEAFRREAHVKHPNALIWKIVRDTVADFWRIQSRNRWDEIESIPEEIIAEFPNFEEELDRQRRQAWLEEAILSLGCDIRGPIYLFYIEGYPIRTIARIYRKTPSAVKMALHRGRQRLSRKKLRTGRDYQVAFEPTFNTERNGTH